MSWSVYSQPSFNTTIPRSNYNLLSGFGQRFMLTQDSSLMTPGKAEPHLPAETMKGTYKRKRKGKNVRKKKPPRCKDLIMPMHIVKQEKLIVQPRLKQPKLSKKRKRVK